jgi:hypothetical protein
MKASTFQKIMRCVKIHYWMQIPEEDEDNYSIYGYDIDSDDHWIPHSDTESRNYHHRQANDYLDEEYHRILKEELQDAEQLEYETSQLSRAQTPDPNEEVATDEDESEDQ